MNQPNVFFLILIFTAVKCFITSFAVDVDLDSMTNEELENICTSRGFELVKEMDPTTGAERQYSKEDYLEAAIQCLEIEAEMEDLLEKHPELVEEINAEVEKMKLEQEELEKELATMKSDFDNSKETISDERELDRDESSYELKLIDLWLKTEGLNLYGDSEGTIYLGGNPLFDEQTGQSIERIDYIRQKFPENPWKNEDRACNDGYIEIETVQDVDEVSNQKIEPEKNLENDKNTKVDSIKSNELLTFHDLMNELQAKVKHDITFLINLIVPKHLQQPLMNAVKPVFRIVKRATLTVYDLVKRYTLLIIKEIQNQPDDQGNKS